MKFRFLALLPLSFPTVSFAGMQSVDCRQPDIFPGARVNVVILPYDYIGRANAIRSNASEALGLVLQRDILLALLRFRDIAAVQLAARSEGTCDANVIADQIQGKRPGARHTLQPHRAAVLLSGIVYEEGQDLYVRSFLRIITPDAPEARMQIRDERLLAPVPLRGISFSPVRLTSTELHSFVDLARKSSVLHSAPDESAPAINLPLSPDLQITYTVAEQRGEWMRVVPSGGGQVGWMHAATGIGAGALRTRMPEIHFLVSAVGYLLALNTGTEDPHPTVRISRGELKEFEQASRLAENPEATVAAAARTLSAHLSIMDDRGTASWRAAVADLDKALQSAPADPEIRNFSAICRAWLVYNAGDAISTVAIANDLRDAATRSADPRILANLQKFYRVMIAQPRSGQPARQELEAELLKLGSLQR